MKLGVIVQGSHHENAFFLEPGESLEVPLTWVNITGGPHSLEGAAVVLRLSKYDTGALVYSATLADPLILGVPAVETAKWPLGKYVASLWETTPAATVNAGEWIIYVLRKPPS